MAVYMVPGVFGVGGQVLDSNGKVVSGALVNVYAAGTVSVVNVFKDSLGAVTAANPVVTNSDGRIPSELWQTGGTAIKIVLTDSLLNTLGTYDNLVGINDPTALLTTTNNWTVHQNFNSVSITTLSVAALSVSTTISSLTVSSLTVTSSLSLPNASIIDAFVNNLGRFQFYSSSNSFTPARAGNYLVYLVGGGGGGAAGGGINSGIGVGGAGAGGAGGNVACSVITLTAGQVVSVTIGSGGGGGGGATGNGADGTAGNPTTFGALLTAVGGSAGKGGFGGTAITGLGNLSPQGHTGGGYGGGAGGSGVAAGNNGNGGGAGQANSGGGGGGGSGSFLTVTGNANGGSGAAGGSGFGIVVW